MWDIPKEGGNRSIHAQPLFAGKGRRIQFMVELTATTVRANFASIAREPTAWALEPLAKHGPIIDSRSCHCQILRIEGSRLGGETDA
jgi:hypothetical protein